MKILRSTVVGTLLVCSAALGQSKPDPKTLQATAAPAAPPSAAAQPAPAADAAQPAPAGASAQSAPADAPAAQAAPKTGVNLVGQVDASSGEARRNENVVVQALDNNLLKDSNTRLGATTTIIQTLDPERSYFAGEYGKAASSSVHAEPAKYRGFHGNVSWNHQNSIFSSRSFFQAGGVQPAHTNEFTLSTTARAWRNAFVTLNARQRDAGGQVNGNILVPPTNARTALTTDPATRAIVQAILNAYPTMEPNRTDISPYALNTNAPQKTVDKQAGGKLNQTLGTADNLAFSYNFVQQVVHAFQLVVGQNPNTTTRNHSIGFTWTRTISPTTIADFTANFNRVTSVLQPDAAALGPNFSFSEEFTKIGDSTYPVDRVQNTFRYAGRLRRSAGKHELVFGAEADRQQINGYESQYNNGRFSFRNEPGVSVLDNMRLGKAEQYVVGIGNIIRGFRYYEMQFYAGDNWRASDRLTVRAGLSYRPSTVPVEANHLTTLPFKSDLNNVAPSLALAYRLPGSWGVLRSAYAVQFGQLYPATFLQSRFNPPGSVRITVQGPSLVNPLANIDVSKIDSNTRSSIIAFSPDLRTPYSNVYNFDWQLPIARRWTLDLGYVGSRTVGLFTAWMTNRGRSIPGVALTTATIDQRRPDQRYYDVTNVLNGSRSYYDAAKVTLRIPEWRRISSEVSYWFSKSIDLGSDYIGTAAGKDATSDAVSPSEFDVQARMKSVSNFDQPHAFLWRANYRAPVMAGAPGWVRSALAEWQIDSVLVLKSGSPFGLKLSDGAGFGNVDGVGGDRPNLLDPSILGRTIDNPDTSVAMLPRTAFGYLLPGQLAGNLGRNAFRKDGIFNVNLSLTKRWAIEGQTSLQFRADSLNALNHPQFAEPGQQVTAATFGMITNTLNDGRAFRFNLALGW